MKDPGLYSATSALGRRKTERQTEREREKATPSNPPLASPSVHREGGEWEKKDRETDRESARKRCVTERGECVRGGPNTKNKTTACARKNSKSKKEAEKDWAALSVCGCGVSVLT